MANVTRVPWEDSYCIASNAGLISANDAATSGVFAGTLGIGLTTNGLLLDERPSLGPGVETITTEKTTGLAETQTGSAGVGKELTIGRKLPTLSIGAMGLTETKMGVFSWGLLQKGVTEVVVTFIKTCIPYVQGAADPEVYIEIGRNIGNPAATPAVGHALFGSVVTSLGISGAAGERMTMSAELQGRTFRNDYNHTLSNFVAETVADHMFHDYTFKLATVAARVQSFDITIVNNAQPLYYNSVVPSSYVLGRVGVTGTILLAMSSATGVGDNTQVDNYVAGTDVLLEVDHSSSKLLIDTNMHYTGAEVDPAEELMLSLPFEGVTDGTNQSIKLVIDDGVNRGIPA